MLTRPSTAPPVIFCILDGVGWGRRDATDAVFSAATPHLDRLTETVPFCLLKAHGTAVGLPTDADMGNSEVGHNAFGAGRILEQGASLVDQAIASGKIFASELWQQLTQRKTLHLIGLLSDGNVHSHVKHLHALISAAADAGVPRIRVHVLSDGRDVSARSVLTWLAALEEQLQKLPDAKIASGGGRMQITMDRYEADWEMVRRGWDCHVHGQGRPFRSAKEAVETFYAEDPKMDDQWLPAFVIQDEQGPVGLIQDGDAVVLYNFRGDRAMELSRAFDQETVPFERGKRPDVLYAGMMQYDGDLNIPKNYLVNPPQIDHTVGEYLVAAGIHSYVTAETQKFGHVTYFFNGNRSGRLDENLEVYEEITSDRLPFDQAPKMKAVEVTDAVIRALESGRFQHLRLNLANGDMVGHTGSFDATVQAMVCVDACVGRLVAAAQAAGAILLITADHGNADEMYELDKKGKIITVNGQSKPRTSHTLNPVPLWLVDPTGQWEHHLLEERPSIAALGATLLNLHGLPTPEGYLPSLLRQKDTLSPGVPHDR